MSREARADAACRFCGAWLTHTFVDLGMSPLCESYRTESQRNTMEAFFPLHVFVCGRPKKRPRFLREFPFEYRLVVLLIEYEVYRLVEAHALLIPSEGNHDLPET